MLTTSTTVEVGYGVSVLERRRRPTETGEIGQGCRRGLYNDATAMAAIGGSDDQICRNRFRFVLGNPIFPAPGPVEGRFPYRIDRSIRSE